MAKLAPHGAMVHRSGIIEQRLELATLGSIRFAVRQGDLLYTATLDPPMFDLQTHWVEMQAAMYSRFSGQRLRLSDIKVESTSSNPGDLCVACWVLSVGAVVRYRLDRLEVWSSDLRLAAEEALAADLVQEAVRVLEVASSSPRIVQHSLTVAVHGALTGVAPTARLAELVAEPPAGEAALTPSGVSFSCELASGKGQGSIVLESSRTVSEGIFVRVTTEHPGELSGREAFLEGARFFRGVTAQIGLDVSWGK